MDELLERVEVFEANLQDQPEAVQKYLPIRIQLRAMLAGEPSLTVLPGHDLSRVPRGRDDLVAHHRPWWDASAWP